MNSSKSYMLFFIWIICITSLTVEKGFVDGGKPRKPSKQPWLPSLPTTHHRCIAGQSKCKTERDCSKDECCAFLKTKAVKVCKKISLFGEICNPYEKPGLPENCLCQQGLTCTRVTGEVFRCLYISGSPFDDENDGE
ncbi:prokineticin Bv8-like peptide 2 [Stylophora pistillata]|uniref:prokineticin Bv8-like peptide 2 n=1 Tax=Stylophora pistillata TaxID=50429 RepID=UPI000C056A13|nr:prokineticin Bv8-like peptide 2 [Stylophora pistillata]